MAVANPLAPGDTKPASRIPAVDAVRGVAVAAMVLYHFLWDTTVFGLTAFDLFGDPAWLTYRTVVLWLFLGLVGVSLVLAQDRGLSARTIAGRVLLLAACAAAITVASILLFPDAPIFFGVLHHIAVAIVLGLVFLRLPTPVVLVAAVVTIMAPEVAAHPVFDQDWLMWVGLVTETPRSNDYVPVFPWFGAVLAGIVLGRTLLAKRDDLAAVLSWRPASWLPRAVVWTGRNSLLAYMVHQPILIGLLMLYALAIGMATPFGLPSFGTPDAAPAEQVESFLGSCQTSCENSGGSLQQCAGYCRCMVDRLTAEDLWRPFMSNELGGPGQARLSTLVQECVQAQLGQGD